MDTETNTRPVSVSWRHGLVLCLAFLVGGAILAGNVITTAQAAYQSNPRQINPISILLPQTSDRHPEHRVNVTLQAFGGCYKWEVQRRDVVGIREFGPEELAELSDGPSSSLSTTKIHFPPLSDRLGGQDSAACHNSIIVSQSDLFRPSKDKAKSWVFAEDVQTGDKLKCEVYVSPVSRIVLETTAKSLAVGGYETIAVKGFDAEGNVFSSLEGLRFQWETGNDKVVSSGSLNTDMYRPSLGRREIHRRGEQSDILLLRGASSGQATIRARLVEPGMAHVPPAEVVLDVVEPFAIVPSVVVAPPLSEIQFGLKMLKGNEAAGDEYVIHPHQNYAWTLGKDTSEEMAEIIPKTAKIAVKMAKAQRSPISLIVSDQRLANNTDAAAIYIKEPSLLKASVVGFPDFGKNHGFSRSNYFPEGKITSDDLVLTRQALNLLESIHLSQSTPVSRITSSSLPSIHQKVSEMGESRPIWYLAADNDYVISAQSFTSGMEPLLQPENMNFNLIINDTGSSSDPSIQTLWEAPTKSWAVIRAGKQGEGTIRFSVDNVKSSSGDIWSPAKKLTVEQTFKIVPRVRLSKIPALMRNPTDPQDLSSAASPIPIPLPKGHSVDISILGGSGSYSIESSNPEICSGIISGSGRSVLRVESSRNQEGLSLLKIRDELNKDNSFNIYCFVSPVDHLYFDASMFQTTINESLDIPLRAIARVRPSLKLPSVWLSQSPSKWTPADKTLADEFGYFMHMANCSSIQTSNFDDSVSHYPEADSEFVKHTMDLISKQPLEKQKYLEFRSPSSAIQFSTSKTFLSPFECAHVSVTSPTAEVADIFALPKSNEPHTPRPIAKTRVEFFPPLSLQATTDKRGPVSTPAALGEWQEGKISVVSARIEDAFVAGVGGTANIKILGGPSEWPYYKLVGEIRAESDETLLLSQPASPDDRNRDARKAATGWFAWSGNSSASSGAVSGEPQLLTPDRISVPLRKGKDIQVTCLKEAPVIGLELSLKSLVKTGIDGFDASAYSLMHSSSDHVLARKSWIEGGKISAVARIDLACSVPTAVAVYPAEGETRRRDMMPSISLGQDLPLHYVGQTVLPKWRQVQAVVKSAPTESRIYIKSGITHVFEAVAVDKFSRPVHEVVAFNPSWFYSGMPGVSVTVSDSQQLIVTAPDSVRLGEGTIISSLIWTGDFAKTIEKNPILKNSATVLSILEKTAKQISAQLSTPLEVGSWVPASIDVSVCSGALQTPLASQPYFVPSNSWDGRTDILLPERSDIAYHLIVPNGSGSMYYFFANSTSTTPDAKTGLVKLPKVLGARSTSRSPNSPELKSLRASLWTSTSRAKWSDVLDENRISEVVDLTAGLDPTVFGSLPFSGQWDDILIVPGSEGSYLLMAEDKHLLGGSSIILPVTVRSSISPQIDVLSVPVLRPGSSDLGLCEFTSSALETEPLLLSTETKTKGEIEDGSLFGVRTRIVAGHRVLDPRIYSALGLSLVSNNDHALRVEEIKELNRNFKNNLLTNDQNGLQIVLERLYAQKYNSDGSQDCSDHLLRMHWYPSHVLQGLQAGSTTVHAKTSPDSSGHSAVSRPLAITIHQRLRISADQLVLLPGGHTHEVIVSGGPTSDLHFTVSSLDDKIVEVEFADPSPHRTQRIVSLKTNGQGRTAVVAHSNVEDRDSDKVNLSDKRSLSATGSRLSSRSRSPPSDIAEVQIVVDVPSAAVILEPQTKRHLSIPSSSKGHQLNASEWTMNSGRVLRILGGLVNSKNEEFSSGHLKQPFGKLTEINSDNTSASDGQKEKKRKYELHTTSYIKCTFSWSSSNPKVISFINDEYKDSDITPDTQLQPPNSSQDQLRPTDSSKSSSWRASFYPPLVDSLSGVGLTGASLVSLTPGMSDVELSVTCSSQTWGFWNIKKSKITIAVLPDSDPVIPDLQNSAHANPLDGFSSVVVAGVNTSASSVHDVVGQTTLLEPSLSELLKCQLGLSHRCHSSSYGKPISVMPYSVLSLPIHTQGSRVDVSVSCDKPQLHNMPERRGVICTSPSNAVKEVSVSPVSSLQSSSTSLLKVVVGDVSTTDAVITVTPDGGSTGSVYIPLTVAKASSFQIKNAKESVLRGGTFTRPVFINPDESVTLSAVFRDSNQNRMAFPSNLKWNIDSSHHSVAVASKLSSSSPSEFEVSGKSVGCASITVQVFSPINLETTTIAPQSYSDVILVCVGYPLPSSPTSLGSPSLPSMKKISSPQSGVPVLTRVVSPYLVYPDTPHSTLGVFFVTALVSVGLTYYLLRGDRSRPLRADQTDRSADPLQQSLARLLGTSAPPPLSSSGTVTRRLGNQAASSAWTSSYKSQGMWHSSPPDGGPAQRGAAITRRQATGFSQFEESSAATTRMPASDTPMAYSRASAAQSGSTGQRSVSPIRGALDRQHRMFGHQE